MTTVSNYSHNNSNSPSKLDADVKMPYLNNK